MKEKDEVDWEDLDDDIEKDFFGEDEIEQDGEYE